MQSFGNEQSSPADYIECSQRLAEAERESQSGLCCCEYVDKDNKRFHILGCCCNCEDFDLAFTRLITCRNIEKQNSRGMLLTFQERLRIPWRGGAKQVSLETLIPIFAIPVIICISAINLYACAIMYISVNVIGGYAYRYVARTLTRTHFFCMWIFWSILYMVVLFQFTVPLLELLPEENLILVFLTTTSLICLWRTKQCASLNHVLQSTAPKDELPEITEASAAEEEEAAAQTALLLENDMGSDDDAWSNIGRQRICSVCHKYVAAHTAHCSLCGACVMRRDHHSLWLDCCIGESNHRYYLAGLIFAVSSLLLGANLTLTAICHPFLVVRLLGVPMMLPDDCSEVFDMYELGICFVIAIYALQMAFFVLVSLLRQIYFISRGITVEGSQHGQNANNKSCLTNWRKFLF